MRKYINYFIIGFALILMSGCTKEGSNPDSISNVFDGVVVINSKGKEYECELRHTPEQMNRLEITKPEMLKGLTFIWENDKYQISWGELLCEFNKNVLPQQAFAEALINALNSISNKESLRCESSDCNGSVFAGKCSSGNFKVRVSKDGVIRHISIPDMDLEVDFSTNERSA